MTEAVIIEAVRTPVGRRNGSLRGIHPVMLGSMVIKELVGLSGFDPGLVQDVIWGCVDQVGEQGNNVARNTWLATGFPVGASAVTLDRQCSSSQQAVGFAAAQVKTGESEVVVAGGVEVMSRVPIGANLQSFGDCWSPELKEMYDLTHQGVAAERMARKYGLSRAAMDEFGVRSHRRAAAAWAAGGLAAKVMPVQVETDGVRAKFERDEGIRPNASPEAAAALKPAFDPGHSITAGNSSQISDAAAALLVTSADTASRLGRRPLVRIAAHLSVGSDPEMMHEGPIAATREILRRTGLGMDDIELFEVNEAFASVVLAWMQVIEPDVERVNVNGGAIAFGHPLGASGARIMIDLIGEMQRRQARYGLQVMCAGWGIGTATLLERWSD